MKTVILCGGMGTRLREETEIRPKPMIEIGGKPILWHIMKHYARHGLDEFVLCLGYKGEVIKEYFYRYEMHANDFTVELGTGQMDFHARHGEAGWKVTLVDTGQKAMTGARVKRVEKYVEGETFLLTYGDGVTDLDLGELLTFHRRQGRIGTVTAVFPPSRYGELLIQGERVLAFREKPARTDTSISGGYFVFQREFFDYLDDGDACVLEQAPLDRLARDGQLAVYHHRGFWQCMDTYRDYKYLTELWDRQEAPWKVW